MTIFSNFFRSLVLTTIFSFLVPVFLVGGLLLVLSLFSYVPGLQGMISDVSSQILHFLATFGSGNSLNGLFIISSTCGFVGALFDIYVYYRYQILRTDA
ncbi:hypothetical protein FJR11_02795 [Anabaena sp. UHCC 0187]|uniref:hypothetical protein n=1 Tax=Anabaena sp. UHCC 0187 TaxID=2590018 RepID=UPI001447C693|nr:hypothetical protein [Anabaena sp. UHCC 0187]MDP5018089.1 hypothetical protein [Dolichospermum sp.]MTJ11542.1 hypothetical protein [Anabaena sp. UHCC 0187]